MNKPLLVVVTGSPASGKSTLAHLLAGKIKCPLLSRDELKEGLIHTLGTAHSQLDRPVDGQVYETFFETIELLLSKGISLVIEAAFQDKLWRPKLLSLLQQATIKIIICKAGIELIKERFSNRLSNDPGREKFHGDQSLNAEQIASLIDNYKPVTIEVPTLQVDTTQDYDPDLEGIINFIRK
jgi:predicted kinase